MTHYFLYIKAGAVINEDTRFYKVAVGESAVGIRHQAWLEAFAAEHGHMFCKWSHDAVAFYSRCIESIGPAAQLITQLPAAKLKKTLQAGSEDPACYYAIMNRHAMMMAIDPHYYTYYQLSRRK